MTDEDVLRWCEDYVRRFPDYNLVTQNCQHFALRLCERLTGLRRDEIVARAGWTDPEWHGWAAVGVALTAAAVSVGSRMLAAMAPSQSDEVAGAETRAPAT